MKHSIWKAKYNLLVTLKELQSMIEKNEDATAAPGAKQQTTNDSPTKGDIEINVGPANQPFNSFIKLEVEKLQKAQQNPFVKLVFSLSSHESAKKLEETVKHFQNQLFNLIKADNPESTEVLDFLHINTNVSENKLSVLITSSNEGLLSLGLLYSQFLDKLLGQKVQASLQFQYEFNVDIEKFVDSTSNYSFYQVLAQNYHAHLKWKAINLRQPLKIILPKIQTFESITYRPHDPALLTLMGLLHTQQCELKLTFDNVDDAVGQLETKNEILSGINQAKDILGDEVYKQLGISSLLQVFENSFYAQASIGDWKVNLDVSIKDAKKLFETKEAKNEEQHGQGSV